VTRSRRRAPRARRALTALLPLLLGGGKVAGRGGRRRKASATRSTTAPPVEHATSGRLPRAPEPLCHRGVDRWVRPVLLRRRHSSPTRMRRRGVGRRGAVALHSHGRGGEEQQREARGEGPCPKSASSGSIFGSRRRHGAKWGRRLEHLLETFFG
jgi:hypothetical protein